MHTYNTAQKESKSTGLPLYKVPEPWVEKGGGGWSPRGGCLGQLKAISVLRALTRLISASLFPPCELALVVFHQVSTAIKM